MCFSSMQVVCTCVVNHFALVSRLHSSTGVCTGVVSQFACIHQWE